MDQYLCEVCGYVYNPHKGDTESQTPRGTAFQDLKEDWICPVCSASRRHFEIFQADAGVSVHKI